MAGRRGDCARSSVVNTIINAFGDNYVTTQDKKIYVNATEGGEVIQFAISITMPKTPIAAATSEAEVISIEDADQMSEAKLKELKEILGMKD